MRRPGVPDGTESVRERGGGVKKWNAPVVVHVRRPPPSPVFPLITWPSGHVDLYGEFDRKLTSRDHVLCVRLKIDLIFKATEIRLGFLDLTLLHGFFLYLVRYLD